MVNRYELIKKTKEAGLLADLIASRCMSLNIATWLTCYETYLVELKDNEKVVAIQFTADFYDLSTRQIYTIINFFEK